MTRKHTHFIFHELLYLLYIFSCFGRNTNALIAYFSVHMCQILNLHQGFFIVSIYFIEQQNSWYGIGVGGYQKPIDKTGECWWIVNGNEQKNLIDIGRNNMGLFR